VAALREAGAEVIVDRVDRLPEALGLAAMTGVA
jgi:hypothetical protein